MTDRDQALGQLDTELQQHYSSLQKDTFASLKLPNEARDFYACVYNH